jgi:hypothetical protein
MGQENVACHSGQPGKQPGWPVALGPLRGRASPLNRALSDVQAPNMSPPMLPDAAAMLVVRPRRRKSRRIKRHKVDTILPSWLVLGFRRGHPPESAGVLSASAPMLACPQFVRPGVLAIAGAVVLGAPHAGVPP